MEVNGSTVAPTVNQINNVNAATTKTATERGVMNKDDFLKLFLASLQYQDPMSPMESKDMMAQMSQLTMVEQITNLGKVVDSLKAAVQKNPLEQGMGFLGKEIIGLTTEGEVVEGKVNEVQVYKGVLELIVNNKPIEIGNIARVANYPMEKPVDKPVDKPEEKPVDDPKPKPTPVESNK
ncbi:flagellar hook capping FlgD N-terminal domain-containing protein [Bacillus thuringiensis]|uniref:flagellar hook capping FlgD N-terminal domain-containing protein n=1 Tax=Bacillus thuringiensis TaxID=1428 RepID=UPI0021D6833E|nr:flagellar hook capping FlgD N-terminal domain-containing protein [Bacillus thuringiensis]MCU7667016.1 flagellar hook assembly protein FlgD [Bacillus thuringiensis]